MRRIPGIQDASSVLALLASYSMENNAALRNFLDKGQYLYDPGLHSEIEANFDSINKVIDAMEEEIKQGRIPAPDRLLVLHQWIQATTQKANNEFGKAKKPETIN